jgi:hypothetical protein
LNVFSGEKYGKIWKNQSDKPPCASQDKPWIEILEISKASARYLIDLGVPMTLKLGNLGIKKKKTTWDEFGCYFRPLDRITSNPA